MRYPMLRLLAPVAFLAFAVPSPALAQAKVDLRLPEAVSRRDATVVRTLLSQKVDVNAPDSQGTPALHWAVRVDDSDLVRLLLASGADAKLTNRYGVTPLTLA